VCSIQIIYNIFRQRPQELFFREAQARKVAVIVRVPLASGLLTGKLNRDSRFAADDHRNFNRHGEAFDVGETFSGVPYEVALEAVDALRPLIPEGTTMAAFALRWILMANAVSVVIPGARNRSQALANAAATDLAPLQTQLNDLASQLATVKPADLGPDGSKNRKRRPCAAQVAYGQPVASMRTAVSR